MANFDVLEVMFTNSQNNRKTLEILRNLSNEERLAASRGRTLLHFAAKSDNLEIARYVIESGAIIDAQDFEGKTPLMLSATSACHQRVLGLLLDSNANIFIRDKNGKCAFQYDCFVARSTIFDKLSDIFSGDAEKIALEFVQWKCCILFSLRLKSSELTRLLLARRYPLVCPECHPMMKETALVAAVRNNDLDNVQCFLNHGVNVNEQSLRGNTALLVYGRLIYGGRQDPEILRLLLNRGANPAMILTHSTYFCRKMQSYTILKYSKRDIVRKLLDRNLDLHARDAYGCCAVHYMAESVQPNAAEELLGRNYHVNARDNEGKTPLHYVRKAHCTNVNFLVDEGADVGAKDERGITPLMEIWRQRDCQVQRRRLVYPLPVSWENTKRHVECLLHRGADAQAPDEFRTFFANIEDRYGFYWIQPVLAHLALIQARGTSIDPVIRDKIYQFALPREYFEKCTLQLEEMKGVKVGNSISLYELLVARDVKIKKYVRNEKLLSNLRRIKYKNQYIPYYIYVLRDRILRVVRVMRLRERIAAILYETVGLCRISHHTIIEKITNYLGERDLRQLYRE